MKSTTQLFKSLSDSTRLRIIWLLQSNRELCVCDLMEVLTLPQSTVSRHLANLRNAGLVDDERRGVWMFYRLRKKPDKLTKDVLQVLRANAKTSIEGQGDVKCLNRYLEQKTDPCILSRMSG